MINKAAGEAQRQMAKKHKKEEDRMGEADFNKPKQVEISIF